MRVLFAGPDPELVMRTSGEDRKPGLHVSDITGRMIFEQDKRLNPESPIDAMVLERGLTWETVLERSLSARHKRPGYRPEQIQEDGIWLSPDWVNPDSDIQHEEWKATKKSSKHDFMDKHWHWLPASMAYLRALLHRKLVTRMATRFRVWFMNGDYSYESKNSDFHLLNDYWRFDIEFSRRELEEKWASILSNGRRYGLLKDQSCQKTETTERRKASAVPLRSRAKAKLLTFQTGKTKSRSSAAS